MTYYHVWFATKRRKWLIRGDIAEAAKELFRQIAFDKGWRLLECEAIVDYVHMLLDLDDVSRMPRAMNDLKGVSARRIFDRFPELKIDAGTERFWQAGYASKIVPDSALQATTRYIQTQWDRLEGFER